MRILTPPSILLEFSDRVDGRTHGAVGLPLQDYLNNVGLARIDRPPQGRLYLVRILDPFSGRAAGLGKLDKVESHDPDSGPSYQI